MAAANQVFVNLPVKDVSRSRDFFGALGFGVDSRLSDERAVCVMLGEGKRAMLAEEAYFAEFAPGREVADTDRTTEAIVSLAVGSREEVDVLADRAAAAGGRAYREIMDGGWVYGRAFLDPDGHIWEVMHMDENGMPDKTPTAAGTPRRSGGNAA